MFIAIVGTPLSGKSTVRDYLVSFKGFTDVRLVGDLGCHPFGCQGRPLARECDADDSVLPPTSDVACNCNGDKWTVDSGKSTPFEPPLKDSAEPRITVSSRCLSCNPDPPGAQLSAISNHNYLNFSSSSLLLDYVTQHWRSNFVTTNLNTRQLVDQFIKRPFFLVISVDAPVFDRFHRSKIKG
jgi:dCMP deaminase